MSEKDEGIENCQGQKDLRPLLGLMTLSAIVSAATMLMVIL